MRKGVMRHSQRPLGRDERVTLAEDAHREGPEADRVRRHKGRMEPLGNTSRSVVEVPSESAGTPTAIIWVAARPRTPPRAARSRRTARPCPAQRRPPGRLAAQPPAGCGAFQPQQSECGKRQAPLNAVKAYSEAPLEMETEGASLCSGATAEPRGAQPARFGPCPRRVRSRQSSL
jgi:hypothetical protein